MGQTRQRTLFPSPATANKRQRLLYRQGLVGRTFLPVLRGSSQAVYTLTKRGAERLAAHQRDSLRSITEADIDAALGKDDPIQALRDLAMRDLERPIFARAVARAQAIEKDLRDRAALAEKNAARRVGSIITS